MIKNTLQIIIVRIHCCIEGTTELKSKWTSYVVPPTLTLSLIMDKVHPGKTYFRALTLKRA